MATKKKKEIVRLPEAKLVNILKKIAQFVFSKKNEKENLLQYILRQFYLPDSKGNPSMTVSITVYVMILIGVVTYFECLNAVRNGSFSVSFMSLIITLSITITAAYRHRQKGIQETDEQVVPTTAIGGFVSTAKNVIAKVTGAGK